MDIRYPRVLTTCHTGQTEKTGQTGQTEQTEQTGQTGETDTKWLRRQFCHDTGMFLLGYIQVSSSWLYSAGSQLRIEALSPSPGSPRPIKLSQASYCWTSHYKFLSYLHPGLHKLWYPGIQDASTWSKFGAHGEHGDVFLFSNLGAL